MNLSNPSLYQYQNQNHPCLLKYQNNKKKKLKWKTHLSRLLSLTFLKFHYLKFHKLLHKRGCRNATVAVISISSTSACQMQTIRIALTMNPCQTKPVLTDTSAMCAWTRTIITDQLRLKLRRMRLRSFGIHSKQHSSTKKILNI